MYSFLFSFFDNRFWHVRLFFILSFIPLLGCGGFDIGMYAQVQKGSSLIVSINTAQPTAPAGLQANVKIDLSAGTLGSGEMEMLGAVLEYCIPRKGTTLNADGILLSQCVKVDNALTQIVISSLRLPKNIDQDCYTKEGTASPCFFPGGTTPLSLEVWSDTGHLLPSSEDWKSSKEITTTETFAEGQVSTTYKPGPCNHPTHVDLLVLVRFKNEPDTFYTTRTNGTTSTIFSQSSPSAKFKLICK